MNYKTNIICDYGSYRSVDPEHTLPQLAWRLDTSLPILEWEILVRVECINLNSASFNQIKLESNDEPFKVIQRIQNIVATRGKMHNPVTGSGGTLSGIVEQVGSEHPDFGKTFVGERICTLFSLSTTPLIIESVKSHIDISYSISSDSSFLTSSNNFSICGVIDNCSNKSGRR